MVPKIELKPKDKQILILVIFFVVLAIDIIAILGWQFRSLIRNFKNANEIRLAIETLKNDINNVGEFKKDIVNLDNRLKVYESAITDEKGIPLLIDRISDLANRCGIKIINIKPITDSDKLQVNNTKYGSFKEIEILLVAESGFHQVGNFVSKLESDTKFFKLSSLDIESGKSDYFSHSIKMSLISVLASSTSRKNKDL